MHSEHYALPILAVREIIRHQNPRTIGAVSHLMQGVINLRGRVLPVCDLSGELGQVREITSDSRILVIDAAGAVIGLVVDSVDEVLMVDAGQIEALPVSEAGLGSEIAKVDDRLIILLDADRALAGVVDTEPLTADEPDGDPQPAL
jgi:purine-binding chemotaxis protein CheW